MDNSSTIYYFFSTIAQVLAATTALVSISLQFQIGNIKRYLLGDGQATYDRASAGDKGYNLENKYLNRLRDSLGREDLDGIEEVLKVLHDTEEKESHTETTYRRGLQFLYNRFVKMRADATRIKKMIKQSVIYSLITILISIAMLGLADIIMNCIIIEIITMVVVFLMLMFTLQKTFLTIKEGLK